VSEFLVEVYLSRAAVDHSMPRPEDVSRAADQLSREGRGVQLLQTVFVPEDEICLLLFEAQSGDAVVETARRCGLRFERLVEAVSDRRLITPQLEGDPR
jgi:hypothetical protein